MYTTLNRIKGFDPCKEGWEKLLAHLGKTEADDEPLTLMTVYASNGISDAVQALAATDSEYCLKVAVTAAEECMHLCPDLKPYFDAAMAGIDREAPPVLITKSLHLWAQSQSRPSLQCASASVRKAAESIIIYAGSGIVSKASRSEALGHVAREAIGSAYYALDLKDYTSFALKILTKANKNVHNLKRDKKA